MKRAEDFCLEMNWTYDSDPGRFDLFKGLIEPIVKKAQEDVIMETVKLCSESAKLSYAQHTFELPEYCEEPFNCTCDELGNWHYIDRNYILDVGNRLIKNL